MHALRAGWPAIGAVAVGRGPGAGRGWGAEPCRSSSEKAVWHECIFSFQVPPGEYPRVTGEAMMFQGHVCWPPPQSFPLGISSTCCSAQ